MERRDLHVHTTWSDGASTPEEVVRAAIARGLTEIGFSDHAPMDFDTSWCLKSADEPRYRAEIAALQKKYAGKIRILLGLEQDYYSPLPTLPYDYRIGSVHFVCADGEYIPVDETAEALRAGADAHFGGDIYALAEAYFALVGNVIEQTHANIVGHFDLIAKFNEQTPLFDESHPRYIAAWQAAADKLLATGALFEINTGAISRGYKKVPYPAPPIRDYLAAHGATFLQSSDSHHKDTLCFGFADV